MLLLSFKNYVAKLEMHKIQMSVKYWISLKIHTSVNVEEMPHVDLFYFE